MKQNNFNFLRFYFAFVVVIGHLIGISKSEALQVFSPYFNTYISVTAFFCISGFLITRSYLNSQSLKSYFIKRAARLLPAYLLVILGSALVFSTISTYSFAEYFTHPQLFKFLVANLSFLNFIEPRLPGVFVQNGLSSPVNGALWTLKVEVSFYLVIPFLLFFIEKIKRKFLAFFTIYILSLTYRYLFDFYYEMSGDGIYTMLGRQLPGFMSYFICGIALNYYFQQFIDKKGWFSLIGVVVLILERNFKVEIFTPAALSMIVFAIAFSFNQLNSFAKYGDISYGIYIYHCLIINIVVYLGYFERNNPLVVSFAIILIVLFVGYASWHILEKRFLNRNLNTKII